jgi:hypothetical protein
MIYLSRTILICCYNFVGAAFICGYMISGYLTKAAKEQGLEQRFGTSVALAVEAGITIDAISQNAINTWYLRK